MFFHATLMLGVVFSCLWQCAVRVFFGYNLTTMVSSLTVPAHVINHQRNLRREVFSRQLLENQSSQICARFGHLELWQFWLDYGTS